MRNLLFVGFTVMFAPMALQAGHCSKGRIAKHDVDGRMNDVTSEIRCSVRSNTSPSIRKLIALYKTQGRVKVVRNTENRARIVFQEDREKMSHGTIQITYDVDLSCSGNGSCTAHAISKKIDATSWADATKRVELYATFKQHGRTTSVNIEKKTKVKRPFIAPGFKKKLLAGLVANIEELGKKYSDVL